MATITIYGGIIPFMLRLCKITIDHDMARHVDDLSALVNKGIGHTPVQVSDCLIQYKLSPESQRRQYGEVTLAIVKFSAWPEEKSELAMAMRSPACQVGCGVVTSMLRSPGKADRASLV